MPAATSVPVKRGRPSIRTESNADSILERLASGESLLSVCRDPQMPSFRAVMEWISEDEEFAHKYARARLIQADVYAEKMLSVSENATPETAQVARLQVDTLKWHASKLKPKVYGDKPADITVNTQVNTVVVSEEKRAELMERWRRLTEQEHYVSSKDELSSITGQNGSK